MLIEEIYQQFIECDGVSIDSRTIQPNQIFFALGGSPAAGLIHAEDAVSKGARLAIVGGPNFSKDSRILLTDSPLKTLQQLADCHRSKLSIPVLGITGSVGKTTTKELIYSVLATHFRTFCTKGNLNNHIGVPLSILGISPDTEIAIIEMGANHIGEIEALCEIAKPTHGLITTIGKAHLEGFGSLEGVMIAKSELYRFLQKNKGTAFINDEDSLLMAVSSGFEMEKIFIHDQFISGLEAADPFLTVRIKRKGEAETIINTRIPGKYNLANIDAAICIGNYFMVPVEKIKLGLESYESKSNRSQLLNYGGNSYLMDAYNANPLSMEAAIRSFGDLVTRDKKVLILGEMRELGHDSAKEHRQIKELISGYEWERVILVGPQFSVIPAKPGFYYFDDVTDLAAWFEKQEFKDTVFLVKGSRGVALEKLFITQTVNPGSSH
jgi:UDP-N-acetylmuramoyl-tripeptide--D-alanyl-D-alanine ligase